jgi:hypothetical protein
MNWIRSRTRLDPFDLARLDAFQLAHSAVQKTLPGNVTRPVRALSKKSSPKETTSRVITRIAVANLNPSFNSPSSKVRHLLRYASKRPFPCNDGPSIGLPTGTKSQGACKRQRARHGTRFMIP